MLDDTKFSLDKKGVYDLIEGFISAGNPEKSINGDDSDMEASDNTAIEVGDNPAMAVGDYEII